MVELSVGQKVELKAGLTVGQWAAKMVDLMVGLKVVGLVVQKVDW